MLTSEKMNDKTKTWQLVGGGIIIAIAFAIMMPGFMFYAVKIAKVVIMVLIALSMAFVVVYLRREARAKKRALQRKFQAAKEESQVAEEATESSATAHNDAE